MTNDSPIFFNYSPIYTINGTNSPILRRSEEGIVKLYDMKI